jgi:tetratricopeptide (TPR) repeat protein
MPSHIFVQLGMWDEVVASNTASYQAATAQIKRRGLPEGREDFHSLSWLAYGNLMLGRYEEAGRNLELGRQAAERNPGSDSVQTSYQRMRARHVIETRRFEPMTVADAPAASGEHAGMPGMDRGYSPKADVLLGAGVSAVGMGDLALAQRAESALRGMCERVEASGNAYAAKSIAIAEKEVGALVRRAGGQLDEALRLSREAADIELSLAPPSGPPEPIKPALEALGEMLLAADRPKDAAAAFEKALLRTPKRTPSLLGLARAAARAGDAITARQRYSELARIWKAAGPGFEPAAEARRFLGTSGDH